MREPHEVEGLETVAINSSIDCPLCHREQFQPLQDHFLALHTPREVANLAAKYAMERENGRPSL